MMFDSSFLLFFFPFLFTLLSGEAYLSDYVNPEIYWRTRGVAYNVETMSGFLQEDLVVVQNVEALVGQLGADRFADREAAGEALRQAGSRAKDPLWKAADSSDPEIAHRAKTLLQQIKEVDPDITRRDQWMAIHSLGQLEDPAAKELLRSIAEKAKGRLASHAAQVLERASGTSVRTGNKNEKIPVGFPEASVGVMQFQPGKGLPAIEDFVRLSPMVQGYLIDLVTGIGDLRLHRVTAVAEETLLLNPSSGHLLLLVELDYEAKKFSAYLTEHGFDRSTDRGVDVYRLRGISLIPLDAGRLLAVLHSPRSETEWGGIAGRLSQSDGAPGFSQALTARMNDADRTSPFWGAALLPGEWIGKVEELSGVRSVAGGVKLERNVMQVSLHLQTLDEEAAKRVVAYTESQVSESKALLQNERGGVDMQPLLSVLETITAKAEEETVRLSAGISAEAVLFMLNLWTVEMR